MDLETSVISSGADIIKRYAFLARKSFETALMQTARGAIRHVISITPPASASGVAGGLDSGSEAKARGQSAIRRDLNHAFAPVRIKHKRPEKISAADLASIHTRLLAAKRPGAPMRRDRAQPYYVDQRKLASLEKDLLTHVGKLAAGWLPAASRLNVNSVPAWISRHAGHGSVEVQLDGGNLLISAVNQISSHAPAWVEPETQRRADYAVGYALNDLERQMPYLLRRPAEEAGLTAA